METFPPFIDQFRYRIAFGTADGFHCAIALHDHRQRKETLPPLDDILLAPPGGTLDIDMDDNVIMV